jgi:aspartate oxidase
MQSYNKLSTFLFQSAFWLICRKIENRMPTYDFIVIGSGIAGLSYTVKVAQHFEEQNIPIKIALITKTVAEETNTKYAQGGIAAVWDTDDSFEKHKGYHGGRRFY